MLDLRQVRSFVVVAEELHFGHAARRLNMTQPPLSRQISLLEETLGARLFTRNNRKVELTNAGAVFLNEARELLRHSEAAIQAVRKAEAANGGTVNVGFFGAATYGFLQALLKKVQAFLPNVTLDLIEMSSREQMEALASKRIDVGLVRPLVDWEGFAVTCVHREGCVLALPNDHFLLAQSEITLKDLNGVPFVMYASEGRGRYMHDLIDSAFQRNGVRPRLHASKMTQAQATLALVSAGIGVAIVPSGCSTTHPENVVFRPIDLGRDHAVETHAVWRPDDKDPALFALITLMRE
nr:LysR family transcriptional regulator [uncultured Pseudomonas sp.]